MRKKKTGWPFQEGYLREETRETHVFTDYRWNTGVVWRDWKVDPQNVGKRRLDLTFQPLP